MAVLCGRPGGGGRFSIGARRRRTNLAGASAEIDLLLAVLRGKIAEVRVPEALAAVCAMVAEKGPEEGTAELAGLFTAALWRLAG
jgi:hypothetical protein